MFRHECYKIFTRKSIYVVLFLVILAMIYTNSLPNDETMKEGVYEDLYEIWGGPITEEKESVAREEMRKSDSGQSTANTPEDRATGFVHFLFTVASMDQAELDGRIESLEEKIAILDVKTYAYKESTKELAMLYKLGDPYEFYLTGGWRDMFSFIEPGVTVIFLSILILLGVTPVFVDEYKNKTISLILATKYGKSKIITAKILAIFTYIIVILTSLHFANAILQIIKYGSLRGWNVPIQNLSTALDSLSMIDLSMSPYAFDIWQFYVLTFFLQLMACAMVAILVVLISIIFKSPMQTLLIGSAVLGAPFLLVQFVPEGGLLSHILSLNYGELMKVVGLFEIFKTYNVLGIPILYPQIMMIIFPMLTTIFIFLIYHRFRHTQIY